MTAGPELKLVVRILFCIVIGGVLATGIAIRPGTRGDTDGIDTDDSAAARGIRRCRGKRLRSWWLWAIWFIVGVAAALVFLTSDHLY